MEQQTMGVLLFLLKKQFTTLKKMTGVSREYEILFDLSDRHDFFFGDWEGTLKTTFLLHDEMGDEDELDTEEKRQSFSIEIALEQLRDYFNDLWEDYRDRGRESQLFKNAKIKQRDLHV